MRKGGVQLEGGSGLGELQSLRELSAYDTGLTGTLPASLGESGGARALERLLLQRNQLSGTLGADVLSNLQARSGRAGLPSYSIEPIACVLTDHTAIAPARGSALTAHRRITRV